MTDNIPTNILMLKYRNGAVYGYLTDNEVLELFEMAKKAYDLSIKLDSGNAVTNYYANLQYTLSLILDARKLKYSY